MNKIINIFGEEVLIKTAIKLGIIFLLLVVWPKFINIMSKIILRIANRKKVDVLLLTFSVSLFKTLMYILLLFIVIGILGIKATSLVTILGTAGIAVGLALQGSLSNVAGGILILFFKPFSNGDYISFSNVEGEVIGIQIIYTKIKTADNQIVTVPNSQLSNTPVTNYTKNRERRLTLYYSASYDDPVDKVKAILNQVVDEEPKILKDKPVLIRLFKHNASSLDYIFRVWVNREDYHEVTFNCNEKVRKYFEENGIEIPYDKLDIYQK